MMRMLLVLAVAACATSADARYSARYNRDTSELAPLVVATIVDEGYKLARTFMGPLYFRYLTVPIRLEPMDRVDVAFLVQIEAGRGGSGGGDSFRQAFAITVFPRAFENDRDIGEERLPASARERARTLSQAIRARLREYEAP